MKKAKPNEFKKFHKLLTQDITWKPWYFKLGKDKDPLEDTAWKQLPIKMSGRQAFQWMKAGFNVGIAATNMDPLVIIDIDDIGVTPDDVMLPTLSTTSRKRLGRHYFYLTEDPKCKHNTSTDDGGEMRCVWEYVVAPGSYVKTSDKLIDVMPKSEKKYAGYYTLLNKVSPVYITFDNIPNIFKKSIAEESVKKPAKNNTKIMSASALFSLTIHDIINVPDKKKRFASPIHGSETGKNSSVDDTSVDGGWYICWRHNVSHSALSLLAVMSGMAECRAAGWGHETSNAGPSTIDFKDGETIYKLWKFAKSQGFIPDDDKIPKSAYEYLCKKVK